MEPQDVAQHWANRIVIEFGEYIDLMQYARMLNEGKVEQVYKANKHLLEENLALVPGKPIKLYFLKEMARDLKRFYDN